MISRSSSSEWSGSSNVSAAASRKTEVASANDTPWRRRLDAAFAGSVVFQRLCGSSSNSNPRPLIGWQQHPINTRNALRGWRSVHSSGVVVHTRPAPVFRPAHQPCLHGILMNILHLFVVFLHRPPGTIKETTLPQETLLASRAIDSKHRAHLDCIQDSRDRDGMAWEQDGVPVIGQENPGAEQELMLSRRSWITRAKQANSPSERRRRVCRSRQVMKKNRSDNTRRRAKSRRV